ncbi:MAG: hypothetical protein A3I77_05030 [Gammaproteobacteria bacterium RIFCSPLOWO2_02_FULL_42_14]|nr:MAG: hypothetical protein A3I77_05030 [Gammaproteobacteria bacterium RIFCSPLOWO2_02_FULL_42_14]OGT86164.1 MAG: hypothetical protein A3G86_00345 [Gammaproteobacteria bacterium RIFCSPLOWO2_12_FULL_42_18]
MLRLSHVSLCVGLFGFAVMGSVYAIPQCTAPIVIYQVNNEVHVAAEMECSLLNGATGSVQLSKKASASSMQSLQSGVTSAPCFPALVGTLGTTLKYNRTYSGRFVVTAKNLSCYRNFSFKTPTIIISAPGTPRVSNITSTSASITWSVAAGDSNISYSAAIYADNSATRTPVSTVFVKAGKPRIATFNKLDANASYTVVVSAIDTNASNSPLASQPVSLTTPP